MSKKTLNVLIATHVTEKTAESSDKNIYVFDVDVNATKIEIKQAFKEMYNITPIRVNTVSTKGKQVTFGRVVGKQKNRKKAVITLPKNAKLDIFEGI
ncbi:50S ribosomal protein L23 [Candidatus Uhrbacteria bacterium RIFOXYB2_FULL_41_10]|nr:MAG: 50S ribosomal protein L23 [Candidatus Uhrbacteria bacterium RIFOXYA2_FULL_41_8]OGL97054.1 MAG: 50S ribosomal protein L23 [Candidatus Uhrbacteria bacterium RIFOXYB2_FULL_41_10]